MYAGGIAGAWRLVVWGTRYYYDARRQRYRQVAAILIFRSLKFSVERWVLEYYPGSGAKNNMGSSTVACRLIRNPSSVRLASVM